MIYQQLQYFLVIFLYSETIHESFWSLQEEFISIHEIHCYYQNIYVMYISLCMLYVTISILFSFNCSGILHLRSEKPRCRFYNIYSSMLSTYIDLALMITQINYHMIFLHVQYPARKYLTNRYQRNVYNTLSIIHCTITSVFTTFKLCILSCCKRSDNVVS